MKPLDFVVFFVYIAAVLAIGPLTSRRIGSAFDFHLCGRSLGRFQAGLSLAATVFSGSGLIGGAGLAYAIGVSGSYWNLTAVPFWSASPRPLLCAGSKLTRFQAIWACGTASQRSG